MTRRLIALAVAVVVLMGLVGWIEPRLTFLPTRGETRTPRDEGLAFETLTIPTADGETIRGWWMPHPGGVADVLYFHGNGGNLSVWLPMLAEVRRAGFGVLAVDYRGYGVSSGQPTEDGLYRDATATRARYDAGLGRPGRPVLYWGRSLGGPVAAHLAAERPPSGVILESTFPSKAAVIRNQPILRALNVFGRYRFATADDMRQVTCPTLVIHGDADSIVPFALGRELFEGLAGPGRFVRLAGGDHNDWHPLSERAYWDPILQFATTLR